MAALADREPFGAVADRLRGLQSEIAEAAHDVRMIGEAVVDDPRAARRDAGRRAQLRELTRKYGPTLTDVVAYAEEIRARLADLDQHDARAQALDAARGRAAQDAADAAATLSGVAPGRGRAPGARR